MNTIHLNIGLAVGNTQDALQMPQIAVALEQALPGMQITESYIRQSSTERTACIVIRWAGSDRDLHAALMPLCDLLKQEAIAARFFGADRDQADMLVGPKAAEWGGVFNEDHWLVPCPDNE